MVTGISIKRFGYLSLCRISYSPNPHVHLSIKRLGYTLHRPTLSRPGWLSLYVKNLEITVDPEIIFHQDSQPERKPNSKTSSKPRHIDSEISDKVLPLVPKGNWLFWLIQMALNHGRCLDFSAHSTVFTITDVGSLVLESLIYRMDLNPNSGIVDANKFSGTLDSYKFKQGEAPSSSRLVLQNLLFKSGNFGRWETIKDHKQLLDIAVFEARGVIDKANLALNDLSVSARLGCLSIQANQLLESLQHTKAFKESRSPFTSPTSSPSAPPLDDSTESDNSAMRRFGTRIVNVLKSIELHVSSAGVSHLPLALITNSDISPKKNVTIAVSVKDFSMDIHRLNSNNPAFRLNFSDNDTAHQTIVTCSSFMFGLDNDGAQEEILYIPLITVLLRTNIFSKTLLFAHYSAIERNKSLVHANVNVVSPSINMEPHHFGLLLGCLTSHSSGSKPSSMKKAFGNFQKLWPKAYIKFNIDEPAIRALVHKPEGYDAPIPYAKLSLTNELTGMVVFTSAKIHADWKSSHSDTGANSSYNLQGKFQVSSCDAWYRSGEGRRFDFFSTELLSFQADASLEPSFSLNIFGQCEKLKLLSIHSEVIYGIREIMHHAQTHIRRDASKPRAAAKDIILRQIPPWLASFKFVINSVSIGIATDALVNYISTSRGIKLVINKLELEYIGSESRNLDPHAEVSNTDNRTFNILVEGVNGYKIVGIYYDADSPNDQFLDIPQFHTAISTTSNAKGPLTEVKSILPTLSMDWDFNLQFLISLCIYISRSTLLAEPHDVDATEKPAKSHITDALSLSFKSSLITIKALLPSSVKILIEANALSLEKAPEQFANISSLALRLYTIHPHITDAWTRLLSIRNLSVDIKEDLHNFGKPTAMDFNEQILVSTESVRLNLAHQLVVYKVLDNLVTSFKGIITLLRRSLLNNLTYIFPLAEKKAMPNIPKIRVKSKSICFSIEDDLFESKLALIFQIGLREQKRRMDYEDAFQTKVEIVKQARAEAKRHQHSEDKPSHRHPTGKSHDYTKPNEAMSFIDSILNIKPSERVPSRTGTQSNITPLGERPLHKIRQSNTFKAFQNSIHPFHGTPSQPTKMGPDDGPTYKIIDDTNYSDSAKVDIQTARYKLNEFYSKSWVREYSNAENNLKESIKNQINKSSMRDPVSPEMSSKEKIIDYSPFPFLFFLLIENVDWFISKPSLSEAELREFLFNVGKGLPLDSRFSIFVPLYNQLKCDSICAQLRDYPLPLLHFPELHPSQNQELASITIEGNFVVAELFSVLESNIRKVFVPIDPLVEEHFNYPDNPAGNPFMVEVHRTVASVKVYTDLKFHINTLNPSVFTWCVSMQPALQATMQVFDLLSKPPQDPSEKLGFWDNIRSVFHARFRLDWPEGNVHFQLKGSSNPYYLVRDSAGFVMCWKNNVQLLVNADDNPQEFMVVTSNDYVLAIPDFSFQKREYLARSVNKTGGLGTASNFKDATVFQKVIMKLGGRVKWTAGMLFERMNDNSTGRTFKFIPHYEVVLSNPESVKGIKNYDAYRGFRSNFIHLAIAVSSIPENWKNEDYKESYNSIHLSPKFFAHFFQWWNLFDGATSLPVRSGKLFEDGTTVKSKKFGRHMYTFKYQLRLSPLFITHAYTHPSYDSVKKTSSYTTTGLKAKIDQFMMDLHQRRAQSGPGKRWKMGFNVGEMDFIATDLRVILASFKEKSHEEVLANTLGLKSSPVSSITGSSTNGSDSQFTTGKFNISDNDYSWIDSDDYHEIGESGSARSFPKINILPLSFTPRWTYFRHTDHNTHEGPTVPFGNEKSHDCLIGKGRADDTHEVLLKLRLDELDDQLKTKETMLESLQKDFKGVPDAKEVESRASKVQKDVNMLKDRLNQIEKLIQMKSGDRDYVQLAFEHSAKKVSRDIERHNAGVYMDGEDNKRDRRESIESFGSVPASDDILPGIKAADAFNNIFLVHSTQIKWSNDVRNAVYSYLHRVSERKSSVYYLTQRAVKYLDDLIAKQKTRSGENEPSTCHNSAFSREAMSGIFSELKSSSSHDNIKGGVNSNSNFDSDLHATYDPDYFTVDNHLVRLVSPQIQFISDKNPDQCVLVTSEGIELKLINIKDKKIEDDEDSQLVETRYGVSLHDAQFFVIDKEKVRNGAYTLFSSNTYGCGKLPMWPPWVSIECCYDSAPLQDALIMEKTTVSLRYDKPNSLRVQSATATGGFDKCTAALVRDKNNRQNRMSINFPKVVGSTDSNQFYAAFTVVMDLLLYTEPMQKERSERMEKVLLATDFTNLQGASQRVVQLQNTVRKFDELKSEFMVRLSELNHESIVDLVRVEVEQDFARRELVVMMEAIKSGMRKVSHDNDTTQLLKWTIGTDQAIWHLLNEDRKPFLDVGLASASFNRIAGNDGFNANSIEIGMLQAFNLMPGSTYPEVISPYLPKGQNYDTSMGNVLTVNWTLLDPIGGIPIVQQFDVNSKPIKVQIESETWDMVFNFMFPKTSNGQIQSPLSVPFLKQHGDAASSTTADSSMMFSSSDDDDDDDTTADDNSSVVQSTNESTQSSLFKKPTMKFIKRSDESVTSSRSRGLFKSHREPGTSPSPSQSSRRSTDSATPSVRSKTMSASKTKTSNSKKSEGPVDDLSVMIDRASSYLSIVSLRLFATTVCVSYKGGGAKSVLDIHEFTLALPDIVYENKTWTNMDAVLHLKRDVTKILLRHTGSLLGNKLKRHHRRKNSHQLNQLQDYNSFTSVSELSKQRTLQAPPIEEENESASSRRATLVPAGSYQPSIQSEETRSVKPPENGSSHGSSNSSMSHGKTGSSVLSKWTSHKDKEKENSDKKSISSALKKIF